jgi:SNF2 family DNA or RNA helicase
MSSLKKKGWLKSVWLKIGTVSISERLKDEFKNQRSTSENFENALNLNRELPNIDWDALGLKRTLTEEQKRNVLSLVSIESGANFSVPGAGKTMTTLASWKFFRQLGTVDKLLVICPKSAFSAWETEEPSETFINKPKTQIFDTQSITPTTEILITNYEKLESSKNVSRLITWVKKNSAMVILDEAHRVKGGGKSIRWIGCKKVAHFAARVDLLTGTPMPQDYSDLRNLLKLSWKNLPEHKVSDTSIKKLERGGVFVRTTKSELNLPPQNINEVLVEQSDIQKQIYSALKSSYHGSILLPQTQEDHFQKKGRAVMLLIASATNPGLLAGMQNEDAFLNLRWPPIELATNATLIDAVENYVSLETPPKYKWLIEFTEQSFKENRKVLIWSSLVGNLRSVAKLLEPYNPAIVYGSTSQEDRKTEILKFKSDPSCGVLITNPQTLGEGISLHKECNCAVYLDRTYNAGQYLQSLDRIHRLGLSEETITNIYILKTKSTIDERISIRLTDKIQRMAKVLDDEGLIVDTQPITQDENFSSLNYMDEKDFDDLLQHLSSNV